MSAFLIRIARVDEEPVFLRPNSTGERDFAKDVVSRVMQKLHDRHLVEDVVTRTVAKGVGMLCTENHVRADLTAVLAEVDPLLAVQEDLTTALADALMDLKSEVVPS